MYNYDYDIAAVIIYFVLAIYYVKQRHISNKQSRIFSILFITTAMVPISDILASFMINYRAEWIFTVLWNSIYYLAKISSPLLFLLYFISQLELDTNKTVVRNTIFLIPYISVVLVILLNPVTEILFSYDEITREYHSGSFRRYFYAIYAFYFLLAVLYVYSHKKHYRRKIRVMSIVICVINILPNFIQFVREFTLMTGLALAISMMLLILMMDVYDNVVDPTTGLIRRGYLAQACSRLMFNNVPFNAVMVRIADYDMLAITYGTRNAEALENEVAKKIYSFAQRGGAFSMGEGFYVILESTSKESDERLEDTLMNMLNQKWIVNEVEIGCEFYITTVSYPKDVCDVESLKAYRSHFGAASWKKCGIVKIDQNFIHTGLRAKQVEAAIERGLERDGFEVYYQPIYRAGDGKFVSAEALIRLYDEELGNISPAEFIPVAETSGLIIRVGRVVLKKVCRFISEHDMEELGLDYIEFNLSVVECMQHSMPEKFNAILEEYGVDPKYLVAEVTETSTAASTKVFTQNLGYLVERGLTLALDDFGTGYANLERLIASRFSIIKFDREITTKLLEDSSMRELAGILLTMFHNMHCKIVAEGVETEEQLNVLKELGCEFIQGWYFSKALQEKEFVEFIRNNK